MRVARRLAGIGADDLATTAAFDAYVGPAREVTVDPVRALIKLHDGSTPGGVSPLGSTVNTVVTRTALAAVDTTAFKTVFLKEVGREGVFTWQTGDFSTKITADTAQGIYVKATAIAATAGSWVRAFSGPWLAGWFGLSPSATASANVTAFNAMLALAVLADSEIAFDKGTYQFNAKITVSTAFNLVLQSDAIKECDLRWTNSDGGLDISFTTTLQPPTIRGFNFTTTYAGGGTALKVTGQYEASITQNGPLIEDIDCRGADTSTAYWTTGIYCKLCWYPRIIRPDIKGKDEAINPFSMPYAIYLEDCQAPLLRDVALFHCERAVYGTGSLHGEGLDITGGNMVGISYGIDWNIGAVKPSIVISGLHINAYVRNIRLTNVYQITISDLVLYKVHVSTSIWEGIELTNCSQIDIHDVKFSTAGVIDTTHGSTPIALVNSFDCQIHDCLAFGWVTPNSSFVVLANPSTANNVISGLTIANDGSRANFAGFIGKVSAPGANTIRDCVPDIDIPMASGDTTPDVSNMASGILEYTGSAVSVTTFDNPIAGQEFTLFSNTGSGVITLVNNATGTGLILRGGTNYLLPAGASIHFKYFGGLWREIWRSL